MHLALLALALQLRTVAMTVPPQPPAAAPARDSAGDLRRARSAQAGFERNRRNWLPVGGSSNGRCDVRLGRFCWWYDDQLPSLPPESELITKRRADLLRTLDELGTAHPGDDWIAGMRVHYRIESRNAASADSVARECRASAWWCAALRGYAAHALGDGAHADSAFTASVAAMADDAACAWRDITPLLRDDDRDTYHARDCAARVALETRYWLMSQPRIGASFNEWRSEFYVRRVQAWLAERSVTPQGLTWGKDSEELLLRYGWPSAWSRTGYAFSSAAEPGIIGHDPSPSFAFAPEGALADSARMFAGDAWDLVSPQAMARFAPHRVQHVAALASQVARFRRGDSALVVAAWATADDSVRAPAATLGVITDSGTAVMGAPDSARVGHSSVAVRGSAWLVGVDLVDTTSNTLARMRTGIRALPDSARIALSDILLYRAGDDPASSLDSAAARAIPGDTVSRRRALGLFWETYGLEESGETLDVSVSVERLDHGLLRSAKQRLGLAPADAPIRMKWVDARPPVGRAAPHAISLDLNDVEPGRYRITLTLSPASGSGATTSREITLLGS